MPLLIASPDVAPVGNLQHLGLHAFMPHPLLAAWHERSFPRRP